VGATPLGAARAVCGVAGWGFSAADAPRSVRRGRHQYVGMMRSLYEGSFSPTSKFILVDRRDFYLAGREMRTYLDGSKNYRVVP
jgi:hypothetical protein